MNRFLLIFTNISHNHWNWQCPKNLEEDFYHENLSTVPTNTLLRFEAKKSFKINIILWYRDSSSIESLDPQENVLFPFLISIQRVWVTENAPNAMCVIYRTHLIGAEFLKAQGYSQGIDEYWKTEYSGVYYAWGWGFFWLSCQPQSMKDFCGR